MLCLVLSLIPFKMKLTTNISQIYCTKLLMDFWVMEWSTSFACGVVNKINEHALHFLHLFSFTQRGDGDSDASTATAQKAIAGAGASSQSPRPVTCYGSWHLSGWDSRSFESRMRALSGPVQGEVAEGGSGGRRLGQEVFAARAFEDFARDLAKSPLRVALFRNAMPPLNQSGTKRGV